MNIEQWLTKINSISDTYLLNKQHIVNFINLVPSKYLTLKEIKFPNKIVQMISNKEYLLIWDCEFQVFKSPPKYKCKKTNFEIVSGQKMIRCISEIGIILIFNINNTFYISALFHCGFLNLQLGHSFIEYMPFYHEYMSVQKSSLQKIMNIESKIFPHLKFQQIWNNFLKNSNSTAFSNEIIKLTNNKILKANKHILSTFNKQMNVLITLLEDIDEISSSSLDPTISKLYIKIVDNLKNIIYNNSIKKFNKYQKNFKNISQIYLNDKYIQNILVKIHSHKSVIHNINLIISDVNCLNVVKGPSDIVAVINHNLFLNKCHNLVSQNNIIDIADYNNKIHEICHSAKLYESYLCLSKNSTVLSDKYDEALLLQILKKYMKTDFKPHNPLVDSYYTLQVFIFFNLINK